MLHRLTLLMLVLDTAVAAIAYAVTKDWVPIAIVFVPIYAVTFYSVRRLEQRLRQR